MLAIAYFQRSIVSAKAARTRRLAVFSAIALLYGVVGPESHAAPCPREVRNPETPPNCDGKPENDCCEFNSVSQVYCFWQKKRDRCERTAMIYKYYDIQRGLQKLGIDTEATGRLDEQTIKSLQKYAKDNGYPVAYTPDPEMLKQIIKQTGGEKAPK